MALPDPGLVWPGKLLHFHFTLHTPGLLPGNEDSLLPTGMAGDLLDIRQGVFSQTNRYFGVSGMLKQSFGHKSRLRPVSLSRLHLDSFAS